ncbi:MAG: hypothetical protein ACREEW_15490, partial [Caulobacteraceae bacterium]
PPAAAPPPAVRATMTALQRVCLPVLRGAPLKTSAKAAGFRLKDGVWTMPVARGRRIGLEPPDTANPHVCALHIVAEAAAAPSMRATLAAWASGQSPPLKQVEADVVVPGPAFQHVTSTWTARTAAGAEGVVLSQDEALPGKPALAGTRRSALLVSLTPA